MKIIAMTAIVGLTLSACAPAPDYIASTPVAQGAYSNLNCANVRAELATEKANLDRLTAEQNNIRTVQGGSIVLGGLIGLAVTSGMNKQSEIAATKGRIEALSTKGC